MISPAPHLEQKLKIQIVDMDEISRREFAGEPFIFCFSTLLVRSVSSSRTCLSSSCHFPSSEHCFHNKLSPVLLVPALRFLLLPLIPSLICSFLSSSLSLGIPSDRTYPLLSCLLFFFLLLLIFPLYSVTRFASFRFDVFVCCYQKSASSCREI